jgi:hypothetical protein
VLSTFTTTTKSLDAANVTVSHTLANGSKLAVAQFSQRCRRTYRRWNLDFTLHLTAWRNPCRENIVLRGIGLPATTSYP